MSFILEVPNFLQFYTLEFLGVGCVLLEKLTKISTIAELYINQKTPKN